MQADPSKSPEVRELQSETKQLVEAADVYNRVAIATPEHYALGAEELKRVKGAIARLEKIRKGMTQPLDMAKKAIIEFFRPFEDQLERAEGSIKRVLIAYNNEQQRIQREAQLKVEADARKERERLEQRAANAEAKGKTDKAIGLLQQAATVVAPIIQRETPKVSGLQDRKTWKFEVTDPTKVPREYLKVDESKVGAYVRAMKDTAAIPGVRIWSESTLASSAA